MANDATHNNATTTTTACTVAPSMARGVGETNRLDCHALVTQPIMAAAKHPMATHNIACCPLNKANLMAMNPSPTSDSTTRCHESPVRCGCKPGSKVITSPAQRSIAKHAATPSADNNTAMDNIMALSGKGESRRIAR